MDAYQESKKARDDDFEELMAACNTAKDAVKNGKPVDDVKPDDSEEAHVPLRQLTISDPPPRPITPKITVEQTSDSSDRQTEDQLDPPPRPVIKKNSDEKPVEPAERTLRNSSSFESEPVTVVEKDDNGFVYYKCRFCGLTFNYMNTLRAHERVHDVAQPYICGKCGESFEFSCQLEYHTQQHGNVKGYKCECGRSFFSYTEMLYHKHPEDMVDQEKEKEKLYGAPMMITPSTSNPVSMADLPIPEFAEKGFEPKHPMKVYNDVRSKPYICEYCSKSYADSRQLAYHMYSHRGEKIFNARSSRYLIGRQGVGYTDRDSYRLFPRTSGYTPPLY